MRRIARAFDWFANNVALPLGLLIGLGVSATILVMAAITVAERLP